jgi:hypothetical protein
MAVVVYLRSPKDEKKRKGNANTAFTPKIRARWIVPFPMHQAQPTWTMVEPIDE